MATATKEAKATKAPAKPLKKSEIATGLAAAAGITKEQARVAMEALEELAIAQLGKRGCGIFILPGIAKFRTVRKPATKAKDGINPFTGQPMRIAAKPARNVVKVAPAKPLKDAIA